MAGGRRRRRAVVLGVPAVVVGLLALMALWRVGAPRDGEPGAAGTIGLHPDRRATLAGVEVRQLTSDRTFWAGSIEDAPVFVVMDRAMRLEPGARVTVEGRVAAAPDVEQATREWGIDEATARAVRERGVYLLASRVISRP